MSRAATLRVHGSFRAGRESDAACRAQRSRQLDAFVSQHAAQIDERQADQRIGIVTLESRRKRDTETFDARASGAIIGLLRAQIALNLLSAQFAHVDDIECGRSLLARRARIEQAEGGMERYCPSAHQREL